MNCLRKRSVDLELWSLDAVILTITSLYVLQYLVANGAERNAKI